MHFTPESFWFRIVSIRIAVLPVERSPMISSRWPRPMFVIESIDLMPVWSGSFTPWRSMTPAALNSSGRYSSVSIGPRPSSGLPSGSTTRPRRASPTGTEATRPVRRTGSPSMTCSHSPNSAAPTSSSSRLNARPTTPCSSSSISIATAFSRPYTRAMPSPTWRTVPTSARSVSTSYCSIRCFRIEAISSGRSFTESPLSTCSCRCQLPAEPFKPSAHARVEPVRSDLQDDPADQARVDASGRLHAPAGCALDLLQQLSGVLIRELDRGGQLGVHDPFVLGSQPLELARDLLELPGPVLVDQHEQEVAQQALAAFEQVLERGWLPARVEVRVSQDVTQGRNFGLRGRQLLELLAHGVEPVTLDRCLEQGPRIHAVDHTHFPLPSRTEKSSSPIASSISRRWSASSSDFRVTFSAAIRLRSATSARICSSARRVSASICLRVSSRRRSRSASVSSRMRRTFDSDTRRASVRISSACPLAWPISLRCSSSRFRASSRALSASSRDCRIFSRRSSSAFWIGPKA